TSMHTHIPYLSLSLPLSLSHTHTHTHTVTHTHTHTHTHTYRCIYLCSFLKIYCICKQKYTTSSHLPWLRDPFFFLRVAPMMRINRGLAHSHRSTQPSPMRWQSNHHQVAVK